MSGNSGGISDTMNTGKKLAAMVGASALALALAAPAMAGVEWATVTGHAAHSDENNSADAWGDNCVKDELSGQDETLVLDQDYALVVVKSGSGEFANTLFANASEGETVWADTNGNNVFDDGDQGISHVIYCEGEAETPPPSFEQSQEGETDAPTDEPTDEPSFFQSQEGETDAPTEPDTSTIGNGGTATPADSAWLLVVALGVLLASVVVLTPARAKSKR
jgi:hypothetical protein